MIAITEVEDRIIQACKTIRALPDREKRFFQIETGWPDYIRNANEAYGYNEVMLPRFKPSPSDVSDCLVALAWARGLSKRDFRIVWMRSYQLSFGRIGRAIYRSDETARRYYKEALIHMWGQANSQNFAKAS